MICKQKKKPQNKETCDNKAFCDKLSKIFYFAIEKKLNFQG